MAVTEKDLNLFKTKAELVSAKVTEIKTPTEAYDYVVNLCGEKEACQILASGCGEAISDTAEAVCDTKTSKIICAPALNKKQYTALQKRCDEQGFELISEGMRQHLGGIDIAFTFVEHGIAETGSLVLESSSEEVRLATMIAEIHVAVLPKSKIVKDSFELEEYLEKNFAKAPNYTAFITGASRTADIERVLALGVHGPLELHILLLEDK